MANSFEPYLQSTYFINYDNPLVASFAKENCLPETCAKERAVQLYYAVRDKIRYDPYDVQPVRSALQASSVVAKQSGYCVAKAVLLTAVLRQQKIPARLGFADVTNHLNTRKLREAMGTDLFIYHGYTEIFLQNKWVKATPAFNLSLCQLFNVKPLEFDGTRDSLFHEYDTLGQKHMEYITDHGHFADLPFERIFAAYEKQYPNLFRQLNDFQKSNFSSEAEKENQSPSHVILFTGHRLDTPDRKTPRFPPTSEEQARSMIKNAVEAIADEATEAGTWLLGISGGASGGDILFHEVCADMGIPTKMCLILPKEEYIEASVADAGDDWVERFNSLFRKIPLEIFQEEKTLPNWLQNPEYSIWERSNLWLLDNALTASQGNLTLIALWDKGEEDGPSGTKDMVERAKARGARFIHLDARTLLS